MIRTSTLKLLAFVTLILLLVTLYVVTGYLYDHMFIRLPGGCGIYRGDYGVVLTIYNDPVKYSQMKHEIGPNVGGYRVYNNVIVGQIDQPPYDENGVATFGGPNIEIRKGYFIIEQRTQKVYGGLSRLAWMKKLRPYGIIEEPKLHQPTWIDEYLGRNKPVDR